MFAAGETVGLAEWINDDTSCLVLFFLSLAFDELFSNKLFLKTTHAQPICKYG